ncbi:OmpP1/FadL family transporter [Paludibacter jiangxiensis]|uniref:Outer membrane protein transport protein n=1 Tax=Paludibacter jiangxiensis TaxID=681398 RepID=A0A161LWV9_9BACT|nr:outer membrane protein transport protein [Paludibacter jiangxiensis]GAT63792.1 outer membrane protein transport protein [Paludibacter jiangxiensis]
MIKKSLLSLGLLLGFVAVIHAQDEFDALKASQTQLKGTARYMGMGGAFTALGGDASAISLNPAGLGVYRSSELTATLNMMNNSSNSTWKGVTNSDNNIFAHFNNLSIVATIPGTDQYSSALSFTFDRLKSFNRNGVVSGANQLSSLTDNIAYRTGGIPESALQSSNDPFNNTSIPWISVLGYEGYLINPSSSGTNQWTTLLGTTETVRPSYSYSERGYIDQYSIGYAGNISNIVYLGASIGWQSLNYSLISNYGETFGSGGSMNLRNEIYTTGSGFDVKLGVIVRPVDFLRLGFAYHTPMFYNMTDNYYASLNYDTERKGTISTPDEGGYSKYKVQTPSYYTFGLAAVLGKKGILSFDYQYQDFTTMKLKNQDGDSQSFEFENEGVKANMKSVSSFKVGGEFRATDNIALRLGYNYISPATKPDAYRVLANNSVRTDSEYFLDVNTQNFTAGIGFRYNNWNFDLAYVLSNQKQDFYPYDDINLAPARLTTHNSNLAFTIGLRY